MKAKSPFEKSLLKATYDGDGDPPKEKHVQTILWTLQGQNMQTPPEAAFGGICQRIMTSRWATALKGEIILYRAIEMVGPGYSTRLAEVNIPMQNFNDPTEKGSAHNRIIQDFFTYIKSKAASYSRRNSPLLIPPADRSKLFDSLDDPELMKEVGFLLSQLQHLVKLGPSCHQAIRNYHLKLTQNATYLILKDATPLYKTVCIAIDKMIDRFFQMERRLGELAIEHYKRFETCTRMLSQFFEMASYLPYSGLTPPTFVQRPKEVLASMSSHLQIYEGQEPQTREDLPYELQMSKEELELQRRMLEDYEKEHRKKLEDFKTQELLSEPAPPKQQPQTQPAQASQAQDPFLDMSSPPQTAHPTQQFQQPAQPSKIDLIMAAFDNPNPPFSAQPSNNPNSAMMTGMMPMPMPMMNPMMTGMMNPMMTGMMPMPMMNPMMTGMMNPMMTGMMPMPMMNPMMAGMQPQAKANIDPNSKPVGQLGGNPNQPFGQQNRSGIDAFSAIPSRSSDPFGNPAPRASNPFETGPAGNPFDIGGRGQQGNKARDPFDLL